MKGTGDTEIRAAVALGSIMSFLGSSITAGPVWPSVLTGIVSYQSHCSCVFLFISIFMISNYNTTLSCGADWWIIDKPPVF